MQVTELESKGLKKAFKIAVEAERINAQMEAELKAAGERVKIPGFRPGFIPMKILQQRYGKSVQPEVLKAVINRATGEVLAERQLKPAMTPEINLDEYKEGGELAFTLSFESFPEVPEIAFGGITLERQTFDIEEKEIDEALKRVTQNNPKFVRIEDGGKAKSGHVTVIDFKGMIDGVAFEGGTGKDFRLELGSGQFIAGFEDQLIGAKEGDDKIVKVTFPKDYPAEKLAGQEASFAVKVKEIYSKEAPEEADDEFGKSLGFADARGLREGIRTQMMKEYDQVVRSHLKRQLFDALEEEVEFELPQGMVDLEFNAIWDRLKEAKARGEDMEGKSDDELKEEYRDIAERRVRLGLVLAGIGSRHKLQITRDELGRAVMQQASQYPGQEKQIMEYYRNHPERLEDLRGPILEEKAVDYILSQVKFDDRKVTVEELLKESDEDGVFKKKPAKSAKKSAKAEEAAEKPHAKKKKAAAE